MLLLLLTVDYQAGSPITGSRFAFQLVFWGPIVCYLQVFAVLGSPSGN